MKRRLCPWWLGYTFLGPLRRWFQKQDPMKLLSPYVREQMTVLEPGPGMGYFTLDLARLVGPKGRVVAVELQERMLRVLRKRAQKAGLLERMELRQVFSSLELGIRDLAEKVDFVLVFYMAHEVPDIKRFFKELFRAGKPGSLVLFAEPPMHIKKTDFEATLMMARNCGYQVQAIDLVPKSYSALLVKPSLPLAA